MDRATFPKTLISATTVTSSSSTTGFDCQNYKSAVLLVDVSAASGTLEITPQISGDDSDYASVPCVPMQFTTTGTKVMYIDDVGKYIRLSYTVSASGSFTIDQATVILKN